jgi:hypothetical protein
MRRTKAVSGFLAVVLFGFSGCGSSASSSEPADATQQGGGHTGASTTGQAGSQGTEAAGAGAGGTIGIVSSGAGGGTTGAGGGASSAAFDAGIATNLDALLPGPDAFLPGIDAPLLGPDASDALASCPGPNPAVGCRSSATACVPSACGCVVRFEGPGWECTADCRTSLPLCPDAGTAPDTKANPDSPKSGIPCGNTFCSTGQYCCNANCGTCAPEGADCAYQECAPPASWTCLGDNDCTAADDYCGGCNCRLLGPKGHLQACAARVSCFIAPCTDKTARCQNGQCVLVTK